MQHHEAKMSSKGQLTVPAAIRDALALKEGDKVDFYLVPGTRRVEVVARNLKLEDLEGCVPYDGPPLSNDDLVRMVHDARDARADELAARAKASLE